MHIIGVSNIPDTEYFNRSKSEKVSFTTAVGNQDFTVYGDSFSNVRAGLPFINASTTASNNGGVPGMPGTFAPDRSTDNPASSTYSTYFGTPAYTMDASTGDHTGSSVPVTAEGPGAFLFTGYMDQTDIFFKMAASLSTDTSDADKLLDMIKDGNKFPSTIGK